MWLHTEAVTVPDTSLLLVSLLQMLHTLIIK